MRSGNWRFTGSEIRGFSVSLLHPLLPPLLPLPPPHHHHPTPGTPLPRDLSPPPRPSPEKCSRAWPKTLAQVAIGPSSWTDPTRTSPRRTDPGQTLSRKDRPRKDGNCAAPYPTASTTTAPHFFCRTAPPPYHLPPKKTHRIFIQLTFFFLKTHTHNKKHNFGPILEWAKWIDHHGLARPTNKSHDYITGTLSIVPSTQGGRHVSGTIPSFFECLVGRDNTEHLVKILTSWFSSASILQDIVVTSWRSSPSSPSCCVNCAVPAWLMDKFVSISSTASPCFRCEGSDVVFHEFVSIAFRVCRRNARVKL